MATLIRCKLKATMKNDIKLQLVTKLRSTMPEQSTINTTRHALVIANTILRARDLTARQRDAVRTGEDSQTHQERETFVGHRPYSSREY